MARTKLGTRLGVVAVLLGLVACAPRTSTQTQAASNRLGGHEPRIRDWEHPFGELTPTVQSVEGAQALVKTFQVSLPRGLGSPGIFVDPGTPPSTVVFVFHDSSYGVIWVVESSPPDTPDASARHDAWQTLVNDSVKPAFLVTSEVVQVRGGTDALLELAKPSVDPAIEPTAIEWVVGNEQFQIFGKDMTKQQAIDLANTV